MAILALILVITSVMFDLVDSSCGPPGIPFEADIYGHISTAEEGQTISYTCKSQFKQVYGNQRKCVRGEMDAQNAQMWYSISKF